MPYGPCNICGATNYAMSTGGPYICPSCDCGIGVKWKPGRGLYKEDVLPVGIDHNAQLTEEHMIQKWRDWIDANPETVKIFEKAIRRNTDDKDQEEQDG